MLLSIMRRLVVGVLLIVMAGCCTTQPEPIQQAVQGNLEGLQLLESQLLELVPADAAPVDFSQLGGAGAEPVLYRPQDGWRIVLRTYQLRAASLVAWSRGEPFDEAAGVQALVVPAIEQARANLPSESGDGE